MTNQEREIQRKLRVVQRGKLSRDVQSKAYMVWLK